MYNQRMKAAVQDIVKYFDKENDEAILKQLETLFQNSNGYVNTPLIICELITRISNLFKFSKMLDPACGLGNLLNLQSDEIIKVGYDRDNRCIQIAMQLVGDKKTKLICEDFLSAKIEEKFDMIVSDIPFGRENKSNSVTKIIEKEYMNKCLDLLDKDGVMIIVIPDTILTLYSFTSIRERILKDFSLEMIIQLPESNIVGFSIRTSIIVIKNTEQRKSVFLAKFRDDIDDIINCYESQKGELWVAKECLSKRWTRSYHDPKYKLLEERLNEKGTKALKDIANIVRGVSIPSDKRLKNGDFMIVSPACIKKKKLDDYDEKWYVDRPQNADSKFNNAILREGDLLINTVGEFGMYIYKDTDPPAIANFNVTIVRAEHNSYLKVFFESDTCKELLSIQAERNMSGAASLVLSIADLSDFRIPLLNMEEISEQHLQQKQIDFTKVIEKKFSDAGWKVAKEYKTGEYEIDFALFHNNSFYGFVEVKNKLIINNEVVFRLSKIRKSIDAKKVFLYSEEGLFELGNDELIELPDIPEPDDNELYGIGKDFVKLITQQMNEHGISIKTLNVQTLGLKFMSEILRIVSETNEVVKEVKEVVYELREILKKLNDEVIDWKKSSLDLEEKIIMIEQSIDEKLDKIKEDDISKYKRIVELWLKDNFMKLDANSEYYLPSAEFLYKELSQYPDTDFSPFVLQYCRAIENEILVKIFKAYLRDLKKRSIKIRDSFANDFSENNKRDKNGSYKFAETIIRCIGQSEDRWNFELGTMTRILQMIAEECNLKSPLLIDFKKFVIYYFESNLLDINFLNTLLKISRDYRNKAAHPDFIPFDKAEQGRVEVRNAINFFLDNYKKCI